jgi:hypothetical protein
MKKPGPLALLLLALLIFVAFAAGLKHAGEQAASKPQPTTNTVGGAYWGRS